MLLQVEACPIQVKFLESVCKSVKARRNYVASAGPYPLPSGFRQPACSLVLKAQVVLGCAKKLGKYFKSVSSELFGEVPNRG